jgi:hypothetical protein
MAPRLAKLTSSTFEIPLAKCICGKAPTWVYFISEDGTKQYMFYCNNSECSHYRVADPRTDYVDALKRWNELTLLRYGKKK